MQRSSPSCGCSTPSTKSSCSLYQCPSKLWEFEAIQWKIMCFFITWCCDDNNLKLNIIKTNELVLCYCCRSISVWVHWETKRSVKFFHFINSFQIHNMSKLHFLKCAFFTHMFDSTQRHTNSPLKKDWLKMCMCASDVIFWLKVTLLAAWLTIRLKWYSSIVLKKINPWTLL